MFIDAIRVKIGNGQVANRPIYVALAITTEGNKEILGLRVGDGGEGPKYWLQVLTEIKNRGTEAVLLAVCDGLSGLLRGEYPVVGNRSADLCGAPDAQLVQICCVSAFRSKPLVRQDSGPLLRKSGPFRHVPAHQPD